MPLNANAMLYAEISALQLVVQRIVGQIASIQGTDIKAIVRLEHDQASLELGRMQFDGFDAKMSEEMRGHAQTILDQIYMVAHQTRKGGPEEPTV